jgi:hypothetical protein
MKCLRGICYESIIRALKSKKERTKGENNSKILSFGGLGFVTLIYTHLNQSQVSGLYKLQYIILNSNATMLQSACNSPHLVAKNH